MTEVQPWYERVQGPFPLKYGCVGVKEDGGGSMRGRGTVGPMKIHRAVFRRDETLIRELIEKEKMDVNEVEAPGNTPLFNAAYDNWVEGIDLLVSLGAKVNASNNAGDTPYRWAENMHNEEAMEALKKHGADPEYEGQIIVPEHIPKIRDFYETENGKNHPKPSEEYLAFKREEDRLLKVEAENTMQP